MNIFFQDQIKENEIIFQLKNKYLFYDFYDMKQD